MGSIDVSSFSRLTEAHIADCVALSSEAGWNQMSEDWALFLRHGTVFGLPNAHGVTVASGAVLPYPDDFAWISMVLVTASRRRERIGTSVLEACCAEVAQRGLLSMLDATPAGERIYRPLGFDGIFNLSRWQGVSERRANSPAGIRAMAAGDIPSVTAIDAAAFGAKRNFGSLGGELKGETIPFGEHVLSYTRREPLGVGAIIPWNAPVLLAALRVTRRGRTSRST